MKKLSLIAAAVILSAASVFAQAEDSWSIQYSMYGADYLGASYDVEAIEASYRKGDIAENISVEGFFGLGVGDDNGVEIDYTLGVEGIYTYALNDGFSVEGILGITRIKTNSGSDSELTFGIAGAYEIGEGAAFIQYRDIDYLDSIDIGYRMPF